MLEVLGPILVVSPTWAARLRMWHLGLLSPVPGGRHHRAAARGFGITAELASMTPYALPQLWAAAFAAGHQGVRTGCATIGGSRASPCSAAGERAGREAAASRSGARCSPGWWRRPACGWHRCPPARTSATCGTDRRTTDDVPDRRAAGDVWPPRPGLACLHVQAHPQASSEGPKAQGQPPSEAQRRPLSHSPPIDDLADPSGAAVPRPGPGGPARPHRRRRPRRRGARPLPLARGRRGTRDPRVGRGQQRTQGGARRRSRS